MDTIDMTAEEQWMSSKPDDHALAQAVARQWKDTVAYLYGQWHRYERGCWRSRAREQIQWKLREELAEIRAEHRLEIAINQTRVAGLSKMLQSDLFISDEDFDEMLPEQERYINLQNGLFNLETFKLEEHQPDLKFTTQLDFEYDPEATCPYFNRYLRTSLVHPDGKVDVELMYLVQEALAYSMTARTDMKASFWCVGVPDSGKSTLITLIKNMMGSLHATLDLNQLGENRFLLSGIAGKRVVTFTEAEEQSVLPDALYKAMVGGTDEIYADVKNRPGISFKPIAKFWWAMNAAPRMKDRSGATLNRLKVIPFVRAVSSDQRLGNLNRLLMEERSGIFNWLLVGYERLLNERKFTVSEQSEAWREAYRAENDTEATFVDQKCVRDPEEKVQSDQLYTQYALWCRENGFKAKNMNQVSKEWERLGFTRLRLADANYWVGLKPRVIHLSLK